MSDEMLESLAELEQDIEAAIQSVRDGRRELAERMVALEDFHQQHTPFRVCKGVGTAWNFTMGPAFVYEGPRSIDTLNFLKMPVVVLAEYISEEDLNKIEPTRCYGFVFEKGSVIDPAFWWLHDENRASVLTCEGVLSKVKPGEEVIVDGIRGRVYLTPDADTRANYERLRLLGPPQKDTVYWDVLRRLCVLMIGVRKAKKQETPFDFPEQERLLDIGRRARHGKELTQDDHDWMQGLLLEGMPSPEELMAGAKAIDKQGGLDKAAKAQEKAEAKAAADAGRTGGAERSRRRDRDASSEDADATENAAAKNDAPPSGKAAPPAGGDDGPPDPFAGLKGAALRRAKRKKEMEERRKKRGTE